MPNFKFVISDGKQSFQVEKDQKDCPVMGKRLGETISGEFLGLSGYELIITGGSDRDGFPMRIDVEGPVRKRNILIRGIGFKGEKGLRRRKMIRGNLIAQDIVQINCKVTKKGDKPIEEVLGKKEEPKEEVKEETKPEEKKEAPEEENKEEKKPEPKDEKKEEPKEEPKEKVKEKVEEESKPDEKKEAPKDASASPKEKSA